GSGAARRRPPAARGDAPTPPVARALPRSDLAPLVAAHRRDDLFRRARGCLRNTRNTPNARTRIFRLGCCGCFGRLLPAPAALQAPGSVVSPAVLASGADAVRPEHLVSARRQRAPEALRGRELRPPRPDV